MMQSGSGAAIAAVFDDKRSADACLEELRRHDFHSPWSAVGAASTADAASAMPGSIDATSHHAVASSSDGVLGTVGRFFSGDTSLRRSLVDHGISETIAIEIDGALPFGGAVIVVSAGERADLAASILSRAGADVYGAATGFGTPHHAMEPADMGSSGTGRGDSTGFLSDGAARNDPDFANEPRAGEVQHTFSAHGSPPAPQEDDEGPHG